jgi:hypothetical protein
LGGLVIQSFALNEQMRNPKILGRENGKVGLHFVNGLAETATRFLVTTSRSKGAKIGPSKPIFLDAHHARI